MGFRPSVSLIATIACVVLLCPATMSMADADPCDGFMLLRPEGPYTVGQKVEVIVTLTSDQRDRVLGVGVIGVGDGKTGVDARSLGQGVWQAETVVGLVSSEAPRVGYNVYYKTEAGKNKDCQRWQPVEMDPGLAIQIKGPEWTAVGRPAEYEVHVGGDASMVSVRWDFEQEQRSATLLTDTLDVQRIRWKEPGTRTVIVEVTAWGQSRMATMTTRVAPADSGLTVQGPRMLKQNNAGRWNVRMPQIGHPGSSRYVSLIVDWGWGETSRYVGGGSYTEIANSFAHPGTYEVGLKVEDKSIGPVAEGRFTVEVTGEEPALDLEVSGPARVSAGIPAWWTLRTTKGRPPYEFYIKPNTGTARTVTTDSGSAKIDLSFSTPGEHLLWCSVVDADRIASGGRQAAVLVEAIEQPAGDDGTPDSDESGTTDTPPAVDPAPDTEPDEESGEEPAPDGDDGIDPDVFGGLVIKGTTVITAKSSATLTATDHGGRAYDRVTWESSNTEVLIVSPGGLIGGHKPGRATIIGRVGDMTAYHEVEVVEGDGGEVIEEEDPKFNPFLDAFDDETRPGTDDGDDGSGADEVSDEPGSRDEEALEDPVELMGIEVDGGNDGLGFETINRTHESNAEVAEKLKERGAEPKPGPGTTPPDPSSDPAPDDPNDLVGTWYLLDRYVTTWEGITDQMTPVVTARAAVVRFERRGGTYVGLVVRDGFLPGTMHQDYKIDPLRKGQEVCWIQREGDDFYTGEMLIPHGRQPYQQRGPARFVVQGDRALVWAGPPGMVEMDFARYRDHGSTEAASRGFRISSEDQIGRHEPGPQGDSIGLVGVDVD